MILPRVGPRTPTWGLGSTARIRRSIGVEGARGLARLRLANLVNVYNFGRGASASELRQREKAFYYDARETHNETGLTSLLMEHQSGSMAKSTVTMCPEGPRNG